MQTLNELVWPTINNPIEFVSVAIGLVVLIALIIQLIRTRSISPYMGMPALGAIILMMLLTTAGAAWDLSQWPTVIAVIVGFLVKLVTSAFLWPYVIMTLVAQAWRVLNIATYNRFRVKED